jgi:hypothetical protein
MTRPVAGQVHRRNITPQQVVITFDGPRSRTDGAGCAVL